VVWRDCVGLLGSRLCSVGLLATDNDKTRWSREGATTALRLEDLRLPTPMVGDAAGSYRWVAATRCGKGAPTMAALGLKSLRLLPPMVGRQARPVNVRVGGGAWVLMRILACQDDLRHIILSLR
jgi:hypothetical protein